MLEQEIKDYNRQNEKCYLGKRKVHFSSFLCDLRRDV